MDHWRNLQDTSWNMHTIQSNNIMYNTIVQSLYDVNGFVHEISTTGYLLSLIMRSVNTRNRHTGPFEMKSTKVQNPRRKCKFFMYYANARARKLAPPRVVAVTRGALSSRSNTG